MGKSPGKWIKTLLFPKKSSKSKVPKKSTYGKEADLAAKALSSDLAISSVLVPDPALYSDKNGENSESADGTYNLPTDQAVLSTGNQDVEGTVDLGSLNNAEITEQKQAITKIQALYRGYLARRAFRALKGIIRLQAVVRGHLVRRQAVVTVYCVLRIVKLQAHIRGRKVRLSDSGAEVQKKCSMGKAMDAKEAAAVGVSRCFQLEMPPANAFVKKLLVSSLAPTPLRFQYDPVESNSAWSWLDRWSSSYFWKPLVQTKKACELKSQKKAAKHKITEMEQGQPKRGVRRASSSNSENSLLSTSEYQKPKPGMRKPSNLFSDSVQQNPQNELERVKRSLRNVSVSTTEANDRSETATENSKHIPGMVSKSWAPGVSGQDRKVVYDSFEKPSELTISVFKEPDNGASDKPSDVVATISKEPELNELLKSYPVDEMADVLQIEHPAEEVLPVDSGPKDGNIPVAALPLDNGASDETVPMAIEELVSKEDQSSKGNQRIRRRRSFPLKQEYSENAALPSNTLTLPSYMAATESAKAKARGQGSPRLSLSDAEHVIVRRQSLPSAANGKLNSPSLRVQRLAHASVKEGSKIDRSSSSRDNHEKAEWRR